MPSRLDSVGRGLDNTAGSSKSSNLLISVGEVMLLEQARLAKFSVTGLAFMLARCSGLCNRLLMLFSNSSLVPALLALESACLDLSIPPNANLLKDTRSCVKASSVSLIEGDVITQGIPPDIVSRPRRKGASPCWIHLVGKGRREDHLEDPLKAQVALSRLGDQSSDRSLTPAEESRVGLDNALL
jgi:hypothetical protein